MAFFERTKEKIVSNALQMLAENTNITQLAPGSKARFILDTTSEEQGEQHRIFDSNLMQAFIKYAEGRFLDFFGDMLNLPRREPSHAISEDNNQMFYVKSGTFGDINNGIDFTIPSGTVVKTVAYDSAVITPGIESQTVINYTTTRSVIARSDESFVYVPIRARLEGRNSDVPRNVLNDHSFTSYARSSAKDLKCTNQYAISNGEDRESDESYRYRLSQVFEAKSLAVLAAIRLAALSVPGVLNIVEISGEQGPGTYSLYVKATTPTTPPRLLTEVAMVVNQVTSFGIRPFVIAPLPVGLELVASVSWNPKATQSDIGRGYIKMRNAIEEYLNVTDIGQSVLFSDLIDVMLRTEPLAFRIGSANTNGFEEVYTYRSSPLGGTIRNVISGDMIEPLYNERVILETSGRHRGIQFMTRGA
jgi:uncharacterized phage protein gp47/JayE